MEYFRLGRTGLNISRTGFGAIPIQRISSDESTKLLHKALDNGVNFFDTAHGYTDSEEKIGLAFSDRRDKVIIATKSPATDKKTILEHIDLSLSRMKTDYIDIFQLHNPSVLPNSADPNSSYAALLEARAKGKIRFFGISNHRFEIARLAALSPDYDTIQYPLNFLSTDIELTLPAICEKNDKGLIVMKALSGGLIRKAASAFAFLRQYPMAVPIWGIEKEHELDEFIALEKNPPVLNDELRAAIAADRAELSGSFCRGCAYCMPCPVGINIGISARMMLLLNRARAESYTTEEWQKKMDLIDQCISCGQCVSRCPYELNPPEMLKQNLADYRKYIAKMKSANK